MIEQVNMPGLKLHKLTGKLGGYWAVTVSGNWRIIFRFDKGEAELLDYLDYHQENMMRMYHPPHPGEILKEDVLPDLGLTVGQFATHLGISRPHLSKVLNGRSGISAEMDLKLSEALGQPPGLWIRMQAAHDLWQAEQAPRQHVAPLRAAA